LRATTIHLHSPDTGPDEIAAIERVLASGWLGKGAETKSFEAEFARHLGVPAESVVTVPSCSEALFHAVQLLDLSPGDEVVLPTVSFLAAGQAILAAGATPVLCDVDPRTLNATEETLAPVLGVRTKAVLLLHYGGVPCRMAPILSLLKERGIALIEDAACCPASRAGSRACGTQGDVGVWSFDSAKIMTMAEGGAMYVRTPELRERLRPRLQLGLDALPGLSSPSARRWWEFDVRAGGRKALISDIAAAMGRVQLRRLPELLARRQSIHVFYRERLAAVPWVVLPPLPEAGVTSSNYLFWIQMAPALRDGLASYLRSHGIYTAFYYHPLHRTSLFSRPGQFPGADMAAERTLCLPGHSRLSVEDAGRICNLIAGFEV
jgi:dTDP-4-amino-4,6-dideoxygalactose transaminase